MSRITQLNTYLDKLVNLNAQENNSYSEEIAKTVVELNRELGVGEVKQHLQSYSTKELHEELIKREAVQEVIANNSDEASIIVTTGDVDRLTYHYKGPARIIINQD